VAPIIIAALTLGDVTGCSSRTSPWRGFDRTGSNAWLNPQA
jgi:hypothetical protein